MFEGSVADDCQPSAVDDGASRVYRHLRIVQLYRQKKHVYCYITKNHGILLKGQSFKDSYFWDLRMLSADMGLL